MHLLEENVALQGAIASQQCISLLMMSTTKSSSIPYLGHLALVHVLKVHVQWPFSHHLQQSPQHLTASLTHLRIGVVQFLALRTVGEMVQ